MDTVCVSLAFIDGLGAPEMMLIFVIVLVLFGGQKLPEFARGLGKSIREFKKAAAGVEEEFKRALEEDERKTTVSKIAPPATSALAAAAVTTDVAGPDATVHEYDEYGNEITPDAETPSEPASTAPTEDVTIESSTIPEEPLAPPPSSATPDPLMGGEEPVSPPPPSPEPDPKTPASGAKPEHP
jgi:sec-independent protein translocase protein TatA